MRDSTAHSLTASSGRPATFYDRIWRCMVGNAIAIGKNTPRPDLKRDDKLATYPGHFFEASASVSAFDVFLIGAIKSGRTADLR